VPGKEILLHEHRVHERRFTEDPVEERDDARVSAKPVERLVGPHGAKDFHVAVFRILASSGRIRNATPDRLARLQPASRGCSFQQVFAGLDDVPIRKESADEQIPLRRTLSLSNAPSSTFEVEPRKSGISVMSALRCWGGFSIPPPLSNRPRGRPTS